MRRLAFVVQRYGASVTGGSEALARALAERLAAEAEVTVFTSCARDYVTWRNEEPAGSETTNGVLVRRFPTVEERDLDAFNAFSDTLYDREHSDADEEDWLRRQGPFVPALREALERERDDFDAVLFFTYLYYPTVHGLRVASARSILVPTTHDEPPLRFRVYREVFAAPRAFAFLTPPEEALVRSRFDLGERTAVVAGMGVEPPAAVDVEGFRIRHELEAPYVAYAGRIDAGKGCDEMLAFHNRYRRDCRGGAEMLLLGRLAMPEPRLPGVRHLGFLPEEEKLAALAGARAVVCPSQFESLSIVLLEGLGLGTPALVNARSEVLLDHARRSNAALHYRDADEYVEALDLLVRQAPLRRALGENGRRYVDREYRWGVVLDRYRALIEAVAGR